LLESECRGLVAVSCSGNALVSHLARYHSLTGLSRSQPLLKSSLAFLRTTSCMLLASYSAYTRTYSLTLHSSHCYLLLLWLALLPYLLLNTYYCCYCATPATSRSDAYYYYVPLWLAPISSLVAVRDRESHFSSLCLYSDTSHR
jgi:hypothetical protein